MLFRIKNELDNHPYKSKQDIFKQLSENKATGVISGPADFIYQLPNIVAYIELKVNGNGQSKEQKEFETKVRKRKMIYVVCEDSLEAFQKVILDLQSKYLIPWQNIFGK
jgi:site-specific DNA-adenine methylase